MRTDPPTPIASNVPGPILLSAAAIADETGIIAVPGAVFFEQVAQHPRQVHLLAAGHPAEVARHPAAGGARRLDRPGAVILPGFVNAHAHLDLTHIGPRSHDPAAGFVAWVQMIRAARAVAPQAIGASVALGAELVVAGATVAVGDIAGAVAGRPSCIATEALRTTPLSGLSFTEFFALGETVAKVAPLLHETIKTCASTASPVRHALSPHAPYSVSRDGYALAAGRGLLCTHLAETPEERELITRGTGPLKAMLESLGLWTPTVAREFGSDRSPVARIAPWLPPGSIVVHANDTDDADLQLLRQHDLAVVYCPRAAAYFNASSHFGPHRYQRMIEMGIPVALGTDSIVNLPQSAADPAVGISVLDEMRLLFQRDRADPLALLQMATTSGARVLGLPTSAFTLGPDGRSARAIAGLVAVDVHGEAQHPLEAMLAGTARPELIALGSIPAPAVPFTKS